MNMHIRNRILIWTLLSLILLTLSACTYIQDYIPAQATATQAAPTETRASTLLPQPSATAAATLVFTAAPALPTTTPPPIPTPAPTLPPKPFSLQPGAIILLPAFTHAEAGCTWMGVGGQVIGNDGQPVKNLVISISGMENGAPKEWMGYTGAATAYGPGGFEIQLGSQVSAALYTIQLFDLNGKVLSEPFHFNTSADCQQNLALVNFSPNLNLKPVLFLPGVMR